MFTNTLVMYFFLFLDDYSYASKFLHLNYILHISIKSMKGFNFIIQLRKIREFQLHKNLKTVSSMADQQKHATFETLNFDNLALRSLPIDTITENYVREVKNACFSKVKVF